MSVDVGSGHRAPVGWCFCGYVVEDDPQRIYPLEEGAVRAARVRERALGVPGRVRACWMAPADDEEQAA